MGSVLDILDKEEIRWLKDQIAPFITNIMRNYLEECKKKCSCTRISSSHTKNFYDSVWGTIEIYEGEIYILDSPVLQRLRGIKQLGLADVLYSSATHTRYSHTLGVLQTSEQMAAQIEKELKKKGVNAPDEMRQVVRLAAIFHDCGHMFCSHASEVYFQKNREAKLFPEVKKIQDCFVSILGIKPGLSEIISIIIINTVEIRELLELIASGLDKFNFSGENKDVLIEEIMCMILGFPYSEKHIPFAKVISGQIDSDKMDYLKRDSHFTGVPVAVDMSRVFQKIRVVEIGSGMEYKMVASHEKLANSYKMAIAPAAINTIDQLVISRFMMFENVYYHQKTLTAEEMLRHAIYELDKSTSGVFDNLGNVLKLSDGVVVSNQFDVLVRNICPDIIVNDEETYKHACTFLSHIYERSLFKRCVAFSDKNLTKAIYKDKDFYADILGKKDCVEINLFVNLVAEEVDKIKALLDNSFYYNERTDILFISTPDISAASIDSNIAIDDKKNKDRDMVFEADNWLKSRASRKPQNYLVSYPEDRYIVYIATEMVLYMRYGVIINDTSIYTSEDEKQILKIKKVLEKKEYYSSVYVLAPDAVIDSHDREILNLVNKWNKYEIFDVNSGEGKTIDETYLKSHIKQYIPYCGANFDRFVTAYIDMLNEMVIITKSAITKSLNSNIKEIEKRAGCNKSELAICNIGNLQDGSAQMSYYINVINKISESECIVKKLEDVLNESRNQKRIVFIEDAFCSGKQIISIFQTYMGVPKEERWTDESHVKELSSENKDELKKCKLYFSFVFSEPTSERFFIEEMSKLGLNVEIVAERQFEEGYFKKYGDSTDFLKTIIENAAKKMLEFKVIDKEGNRKKSWPKEREEQSRLGYNNAQQLIAFYWNTPTYTITPLWMTVDDNDFKWFPLFPRIDK